MTSSMTASSKCMVQTRKIHMDLLRILAIFCVLYNHTQTKGYVLFTIAQNSPLYWFYLFFSILIRINVPLFFMISGALLIPKEESLETLFKKRILKFVIILFFCSLIHYLYQLRPHVSGFSWTYFIRTLYSNGLYVPCWYLYAYIAYLLVSPFLRRMAKTMGNNDFLYLILVYLGFQLLPMIEYLVGGIAHNKNFSFFMAETNIIFPLLGYFLEERLPRKYFTVKNLAWMTGASVLAICICCILTNHYCFSIGEWKEDTCQKFMATLIFIPAMTTYFGCRLWFMKHPVSSWFGNILIKLGSCTFGLYLFERMYREQTQWIYYSLCPYLHSFPSCIIWIASACLLGITVTWILKRIPLIKKML